MLTRNDQQDDVLFSSELSPCVVFMLVRNLLSKQQFRKLFNQRHKHSVFVTKTNSLAQSTFYSSILLRLLIQSNKDASSAVIAIKDIPACGWSSTQQTVFRQISKVIVLRLEFFDQKLRQVITAYVVSVYQPLFSQRLWTHQRISDDWKLLVQTISWIIESRLTLF